MANGPAGKTIIADDVEIVGSIKCESDIQIAGKLNGDLTCTGSAVISETAVVKGNISANSTSVLGQVMGNITSRDRIELKSTARLTGDIKARRLTVEDGVTFVGKAEVTPSGASQGEMERKPLDAGRDATTPETAAQAEERNKGGLFGRR